LSARELRLASPSTHSWTSGQKSVYTKEDASDAGAKLLAEKHGDVITLPVGDRDVGLSILVEIPDGEEHRVLPSAKGRAGRSMEAVPAIPHQKRNRIVRTDDDQICGRSPLKSPAAIRYAAPPTAIG
jgi:hypothetical protein